MIFKRVNSFSLILGLAVAVSLVSCDKAEQASTDAPVTDPVAQTETVEPVTVNYSVNLDEKGRALRGNVQSLI